MGVNLTGSSLKVTSCRPVLMIMSAVLIISSRSLLGDKAVSFALVYSAMLKAAIETRDRMAVIEAAKKAAAPYPEISELIEEALSMVDKPHNETASHFGIACHLPYSLPHDIVLLHNYNKYVDAVRTNILAGGDNCGRSVMIGAIYSALYGLDENGLPQEWVNKLAKKQEIEKLTAQIDFR